MKASVVIIGAGPAGLLLAQILDHAGIDAILLERQSQDYVLSRIRAGVLEGGTQEVLRKAGVGSRMDREGLIHDGFAISHANTLNRINLAKLTGRKVMVYGQTEVTKDLCDARAARGGITLYEATDVTPHALTTNTPYVTCTHNGAMVRIDCDYVIGCDGYHGVSRTSIPAEDRCEFERVYPFGWLGVLSETRPVDDELIYATHPDGFALCSMRNPQLSRYYIQCDADEDVTAWSDDRFWATLIERLPKAVGKTMETGPSIEKSVAPLRSYVCETMRYGRLFLAGDAAHIVPPTGAKGLNLAVSDVHYLSDALIRAYQGGDISQLDAYASKALARIWKTERFSWWMTTLLHTFPDTGAFEGRMKAAELDYLMTSYAAQTSLAENYVGLPY